MSDRNYRSLVSYTLCARGERTRSAQPALVLFPLNWVIVLIRIDTLNQVSWFPSFFGLNLTPCPTARSRMQENESPFLFPFLQAAWKPQCRRVVTCGQNAMASKYCMKRTNDKYLETPENS